MAYGSPLSGYPRKDEKPLGTPGYGPLGSTPVSISGIGEGYSGTVQVVAEMRRLALDAYPDERVNQLARQVTAGCPRHDLACEAATLLDWMQREFRYTRLPFNPGLQRLQTPSYTLFDAPVRSGECASLATALAALLLSLGHEVAYRTVGQDERDPTSFEHVYLVDHISGEWVALDPSYEYGAGVEHPAGKVYQDWAVA